jgi:hypothetical protein
MGAPLVVSGAARLAAVVLAASVLGAGMPARGQASLTLFGGYGGTHGIDNAATGAGADVDNAASMGVALNLPFDPSRDLQLLYRQQTSTMAPGGGAAPFDLTVRTLHVGGTVSLDAPAARGLYAVGGVGLTQFSPSSRGYGSDVKPSLSLGIGYLLPLTARIALRAEARGYLTLVNSAGGFLCSGGCIAVLKSDSVTQGEATIGLSARF